MRLVVVQAIYVQGNTAPWEGQERVLAVIDDDENYTAAKDFAKLHFISVPRQYVPDGYKFTPCLTQTGLPETVWGANDLGVLVWSRRDLRENLAAEKGDCHVTRQ